MDTVKIISAQVERLPLKLLGAVQVATYGGKIEQTGEDDDLG